MIVKLLRHFSRLQCFNQQYRTFWDSTYLIPTKWLVWSSNKFNEDRIKEVGPDIACAEWLLINGAYVKWHGMDFIVRDFNLLSAKGMKHYTIRGVFASQASVHPQAFGYFEYLNHLKSIYFHECKFVDNEGLFSICNSFALQNSLEKLRISECHAIQIDGFKALESLKNLRELHLYCHATVDLQEVKDYLQPRLTNCKITAITDPDPSQWWLQL